MQDICNYFLNKQKVLFHRKLFITKIPLWESYFVCYMIICSRQLLIITSGVIIYWCDDM